MNVGTEVMDRARALIERTPGLGSTEAMRRVLRDDPALLARWHLGEAGEPAGDTVDPAAELQQHMAACGVTFSEACNDRPDLLIAQAGRPRKVAPRPRRCARPWRPRAHTACGTTGTTSGRGHPRSPS